ncbi:MAG: mechanosensitive ion channel [Alysiella sp.]|uniref:mechanosensitive ion channel family protein n=1 Tax=Alysiella sp. TaxID=1872483 RepID=UPI0026DBB21A|nr:mechanosensitive ion channel domain-containing protein [Alysiella sp.]MDO4433483.1 mechanosensitive ion channel [Alysiella sp.]
MNEANRFSGLFNDLLARDAFTLRLFENSFREPLGWIELIVAFAIMVATHQIAKHLISSSHYERIKWHSLRHIAKRITWSILVFGVGIATLIIWEVSGLTSIWLRLMLLAANWMTAIRIMLAVLNFALPENRFSDWLERSASTTLWVCFLLWVCGIDNIIINWMKSLQLTIGSSKLNLFTIATGILWVGIIMLLMLWLARWINAQLMSANSMDLNLRIVLGKITTTILMFLSVLIALPLVGIDLGVLSVLGGAFGVGLGFGLQKIASNYVSGFIILADRSIRLGDRLTVNNFTGYVSKITSRFVVLKSTTGQEALIPNETFVTSTVINESYTSEALYQSLNVQVAYHTDLSLALRILKEAAAEQERVDKTSPPNSFLVGFGENGVDLRVGFWVKDPENGFAGLFSAILLTIWKRFHEENIDFPYPQREIRILPEEEKPSDIAILKAGMEAKKEMDTRSAQAEDEQT